MKPKRLLTIIPVFALLTTAAASLASAAEATTGSIIGTVLSANHPLSGARVCAASVSGRYATRTDARGRFLLLGVIPGVYVVSVETQGYEPVIRSGVMVTPGADEQLSFRLAEHLATIGSVHTEAGAFDLGSPSDTYTVSGPAAQALSPLASASGLGSYSAGTVQGALASVPGVDEDSFGNAIVRGGKISDTVFDYDSVPIPQGLIAEPGGNIVGAQLPTTGIGSTKVTLAGFGTQGDNALGGVVDEIPAVGIYPGKTTLEVGEGIGALSERLALQSLWATPDLRWRYAFASTLGSEYFPYGDGHTFYPAEAGGYGLALQTRGQSSFSGNVHFQPKISDDVSFTALVGEANYEQYGSPYPGETYGAFDGQHTTFPGETSPGEPANFASGIRGTYDVLKTQWTHTRAHSLSRLQVYQSQYGSTSGGPFWDDLSFPDGSISFSAQQGRREEGLTYDVDDIASERHHIKYGAEYRVNNSFLSQVVPTADEEITSNPTLFSYLAYLGDTWSASPRVDVAGTLRMNGTRIVPSDGSRYDIASLDPHLSAAYRFGDRFALRAAFDHTTTAPLPLEVDRTDTAAAAPFTRLDPETAKDFTYSFEGKGRTQFRVTYYTERERNRIDVLPFNFRTAVSAGENPGGVGVPTNAGEFLAHGLELWVKRGGLTLNGNFVRAFSSSASQFAYNDLNGAAAAAGHLFPVGYVPDFTGRLSYEFSPAKHLRVTPALSYQTGYPYGNGTMTWVFDPATGKPELVPNDNHVNPGYNYYFLANPALPFNAASNPYTGSMGTAEGADPNTLRTTPQMLLSLRIEGDLSPRLTALFDVVNLLGTASPTQMQSNPYLIGPPGYAGGNTIYAPWYGQQLGGSTPYTLGNGVPTNDGMHQATPWAYGRSGYVPQAYPLARTFMLRLRYRL